jgi:hypothetical protein
VKRIRLVIVAAWIMALGAACQGQAGPKVPFPIGTFASPVRGGVTQEFSADGTYVVNFPGHNPHTGTYVVSGDEVVMTDDNEICAGVPGKYQWAFDGRMLSFTAIDDPCATRRIDWPADAWTQRP